MPGEYVDCAQPVASGAHVNWENKIPDDCFAECAKFGEAQRDIPKRHGVFVLCGRLNDLPFEQPLHVGLSSKEIHGDLQGVYKYVDAHRTSPTYLGGIIYNSEDVRFCYICCDDTCLEDVEKWAKATLAPAMSRAPVEINANNKQNAW